MFEVGQLVVYTRNTHKNSDVLATVGSKAIVKGYVQKGRITYLNVEWIKTSEKFRQSDGGYYAHNFILCIEKDPFEETGVE